MIKPYSWRSTTNIWHLGFHQLGHLVELSILIASL